MRKRIFLLIVAGALALSSTAWADAAHRTAAVSSSALTTPSPTSYSYSRFVSTRHKVKPAHAANCGNVCLLAAAYPQWVCDIQGSVVAAGVFIVSDGASGVWSILTGGAWTAGCHVLDDSYLTSGQFNTLESTGRNCFYEWTRLHKYRKIMCAGGFYA